MHHLFSDSGGIENTYLPEDRCSLYLTKNCKTRKSFGISSLIDLGRPEKFRYVAEIYG